MSEWLNLVLAGWTAMPWLEATAVILALAYLVLAAKEHIACWACALVSCAIYIYIFLDARLYSESLLQGYYLLMAVYGWLQWTRGTHGSSRPISTWPWQRHLLVIVLTGACVPLLGLWMQSRGAALPYLDAFTTCFAIVTTFMVTHKILENWLYWLVVDSISIYLYVQRELYLTVALFAIYLIIVVLGFVRWQREYRRQHATVALAPA